MFAHKMHYQNNKHITVSGANGFLGQEIVRFFLQKDYCVHALVRSIPKQKTPGVIYYTYTLGGKVPKEAFSKSQAFFHCAYEKNKPQIHQPDVNIQGTLDLFDESIRNGVSKNVYFSSISAHAHATTYYGQHKWKLQEMLATKRIFVLIPGLIIGKGGLYEKIQQHIIKFHIMPLVKGGRQQIRYIYVHEVLLFLNNILQEEMSPQTYILTHNKPIQFKELCQKIALENNTKIYFFPLPEWFMFYAIKVAHSIKLTAVNTDNLLGLLKQETNA